ncbi:MAG: LysM domain-containing protein [Saprospiraceae bacterium]|nr:LysM domain-containing protein [Saprospiraceae bacterium]HMW39476.1 LysM domain-containing protein [Saprospiraceae bacterium]HMX88086.1 LysM domain-containing protein [Saprospiraceae bacterium]HMZ38947.1 LysM domain-containing protein [Saprospiraceae bacterium]HNB30987.1 LysM domain-containing protein [Saprospiraceae bacterium]
MFRNYIMIPVIILLAAINLSGQAGAGVIVQFDAQNKPYIQYVVEGGQNLFQIRSAYGLPEKELTSANPGLNPSQLRTGQWINIPVQQLIQYDPAPEDEELYTPVYYKLQPGETILSLTRNRTRWNTSQILQRNKLKTSSVRADQLIQIAWMFRLGKAEKSNPASQPVELSSQDKKENEKSQAANNALTSYSKEYRGVAYCPDLAMTTGHCYAMYNRAKPGTLIEIYNPVLERSVSAKVIGKIPSSQRRDIEVLVSSEVASGLGAITPKFFVYVRH